MRLLFSALCVATLATNCSIQHHEIPPEDTHPRPNVFHENSSMEIPKSLFTPMQQENSQDVRWLKILVLALNSGKVTFEQTISYLGEDAGVDPWYGFGSTVGHRNKPLVVKFNGDKVSVVEFSEGPLLETLQFRTISKFIYDTTIGKDMIVFSGGTTNRFNKRFHGGEIVLRSWF